MSNRKYTKVTGITCKSKAPTYQRPRNFECIIKNSRNRRVKTRYISIYKNGTRSDTYRASMFYGTFIHPFDTKKRCEATGLSNGVFADVVCSND